MRLGVWIMKTTGIDINYPVGNVYENGQEYVDSIVTLFARLKDSYKHISIKGIVYFFDVNNDVSKGYSFSSSTNDLNLIVNSNWQECESCGEVTETESYYNSSQRDRNTGTRKCLCSKKCMIEYLFSNSMEVGINNLWTEENLSKVTNAKSPYYQQRYYKVENVKNELINKVLEDIDSYKEDIDTFELPEKVTGTTELAKSKKTLLEKLRS